jgi:branched-subunit amino acid transport protein
MTWVTVGAVAALCFTLRAGVPLLLGSRGLPAAVERRLDAAVPPLLAALVAVQLFTARGHPAVDARAAGVATATAIFLLRRSLLLALATTALVTALLRLA